jgi:hypothetical protein
MRGFLYGGGTMADLWNQGRGITNVPRQPARRVRKTLLNVPQMRHYFTMRNGALAYRRPDPYRNSDGSFDWARLERDKAADPPHVLLVRYCVVAALLVGFILLLNYITDPDSGKHSPVPPLKSYRPVSFP